LCDEAMRIRCGLAGKERFEAEFSVNRMQTKFSELFRSMSRTHVFAPGH